MAQLIFSMTRFSGSTRFLIQNIISIVSAQRSVWPCWKKTRFQRLQSKHLFFPEHGKLEGIPSRAYAEAVAHLSGNFNLSEFPSGRCPTWWVPWVTPNIACRLGWILRLYNCRVVNWRSCLIDTQLSLIIDNRCLIRGWSMVNGWMVNQWWMDGWLFRDEWMVNLLLYITYYYYYYYYYNLIYYYYYYCYYDNGNTNGRFVQQNYGLCFNCCDLPGGWLCFGQQRHGGGWSRSHMLSRARAPRAKVGLEKVPGPWQLYGGKAMCASNWWQSPW